jgi:hypothetical protein
LPFVSGPRSDDDQQQEAYGHLLIDWIKGGDAAGSIAQLLIA